MGSLFTVSGVKLAFLSLAGPLGTLSALTWNLIIPYSQMVTFGKEITDG